jgi:ubiquinone/menaquinone biosynthesis C-methylase UbiE
VILDGVKHEILESRSGGDTLLDVVRLIVQESWGLEHPPAEVHVPNQRVLLTQNRVEREYLREAAPPTVAETDFWSDYLRKYELLDRVDDYRDYLDLVGDLLGPFAPAEMILDAGCGVGLLGAWLLRRIQRSVAKDMPRFYCALDLTDSGLADAMGRHGGLISAALGKLGAGAGVNVQYARADFDRLPRDGETPAIPMFQDGTFDAICCSLVLSYLVEPVNLLRELRRVARPGARIVVSSMKPHCDMSVIYHDFIDQQVNPNEVDSARNLLRAAGQIKLKEEQGFYRFLSGEDMAEMLTSAGFSQTRIFSSFGEQAFVVRASA